MSSVRGDCTPTTFSWSTQPGEQLSKDQYFGQIASGELDYLVWEPDAIEVRWYGEAAVLRYQARAQATFAGQKTPLRRFWHTDVYEKRSGRWQVVWSQATQFNKGQGHIL